MVQFGSERERRRITFDAFTLDEADESLWNGSTRIPLRPKPFALLRLLLENPGCLVTKDQLFNVLWPDCSVGEGVLKHCVSEIRNALNDSADMPRLIETAHRRGYRFIGKIDGRDTHEKPVGFHRSAVGTHGIVGRSYELVRLVELLKRMLGSVRQIVFISGEQGIGKSALVESFLEQVNHENKWLWIAKGQCIRFHDPGGPFSPFHEAIKSLCSRAVRKQMLPVLQRNAPHWLLQMPPIISDAELRALRRHTADYKPGGILREMAEGLEALTAKSPLILVIEDLQWGDSSTLELISYLGRRREPARLLLIATYRPSELAGDNGLLVTAKRELQMHQECQELILPALSERDVEEYLVRRFRNHKFPAMIAGWIHKRIGGNPLHMVNCLESMITAGLISLCGEHWTLNGTLERAEEMVSSSVVKYRAGSPPLYIPLKTASH